jgi:ferric-dicitrate binding protein FerR (iron transport regulator)
MQADRGKSEKPSAEGGERAGRRLDRLFSDLGPGSCPSEDAFAAFLDGGLGAEESGRIKDHLKACPACRETAETFGEMQPGTEQTADLSHALKAKLVGIADRAGTARPPVSEAGAPSTAHRRLALLAVSTAAAALLIAGLLLLAKSRKPGGPEKEPTPFVVEWPDEPSRPDGTAVDRKSDPLPKEPEEQPSRPPQKPEPAPEEVEKPEIPIEPVPPPAEKPERPAPEEVEKPGEGKDAPKEEEKPSVVEKPQSREKPSDTTEPVARRRPRALAVDEVRGEVFYRKPSDAQPRPVTAPSRLAFDAEVSTPAGKKGYLRADGRFQIYLGGATRADFRSFEDGTELALARGELLVEDRGGKGPMKMEVPGGWATAVPGASFTLARVNGKVHLGVIERKVAVQTAGGDVTLDAGLSLVLGGQGDPRPARFDPNRAVAWTHDLRPGFEQVMFYDFESGLKGWKGKTETRQTHRHSRRSLRAVRVRDRNFTAAVSKSNRHLFRFRPGLFLRFAFFADPDTHLGVRLWNRTANRNVYLPIFLEVRGTWAWAELDVTRAAMRLPEDERPRVGDIIAGLVVGLSSERRDAVLVIDDFQAILRIPPRSAGGSGFRTGPAPAGAPSLVPDGRDCRCPGRTHSAVCRFAKIIRLLKRYQPMTVAGGRKGPRDKGGSKDGEDEDKGKEEKKEDEEKPEPPPGPPHPPGPGVPPGPPPGPAPGPPSPPDKKTGEGEDGKSGEGKSGESEKDKDKEKEKEKEPSQPRDPRKPKSGMRASNAAIYRWLKNQLPKRWPLFVDWRPDCGCAGQCKCLKTIRKFLEKHPEIKKPIWRTADRQISGPFEAWFFRKDKGK